MNRSADEVADVPRDVMTVTSTVPAKLSGDGAVIVVELTTMKPTEGVVPKSTYITPLNP